MGKGHATLQSEYVIQRSFGLSDSFTDACIRYEKQVRKFKRILDTSTAMEVHYVPGNEDVG